LNTRILDPRPECDFLVFEIRDLGEIFTGCVGRFEVLRPSERKLAVGVFRDIFGIGGVFLLAFSELASFSGSFLFGL
jgi:hypothetical protein